MARAPFSGSAWRTLFAVLTCLVAAGFRPDAPAHAIDGQHRETDPTSRAREVVNQEPVHAQRLYSRVMQEFRSKDYEAALAGFRFFMALHGESHLAPSAQYWIGECEFYLGRYQDAITTFSHVLTVSQQRRKLAAATLKMGLAYEKLGQDEAARVILERVVAEFPDTPEVQSARQHLGALSNASVHLP